MQYTFGEINEAKLLVFPSIVIFVVFSDGYRRLGLACRHYSFQLIGNGAFSPINHTFCSQRDRLVLRVQRPASPASLHRLLAVRIPQYSPFHCSLTLLLLPFTALPFSLHCLRMPTSTPGFLPPVIPVGGHL